MATKPGDPGGSGVLGILQQIAGAQQAFMTGSTAAASSDTPYVYWGSSSQYTGQYQETVYEKDTRPRPRNVQAIDGDPSIRPDRAVSRARAPYEVSDQFRDEAGARAAIYQWQGTAELQRWEDKLVSLGLITEDDRGDFGMLSDWWDETIDYSIRFTQAGKKLTPWQVIELLASTGARSGRSGRSEAFTGRRTSTSTSIDLTDPNTAKAIVSDVLADRLGRTANDDEVRAFTSALNAQERANPTVTNTTSDYNEGVVTSQSSTTSGGISGAGKQQIAADRAMTMPEYGAYQAAGTYFNALLASVASPV